MNRIFVKIAAELLSQEEIDKLLEAGYRVTKDKQKNRAKAENIHKKADNILNTLDTPIEPPENLEVDPDRLKAGYEKAINEEKKTLSDNVQKISDLEVKYNRLINKLKALNRAKKISLGAAATAGLVGAGYLLTKDEKKQEAIEKMAGVKKEGTELGKKLLNTLRNTKNHISGKTVKDAEKVFMKTPMVDERAYRNASRALSIAEAKQNLYRANLGLGVGLTTATGLALSKKS